MTLRRIRLAETDLAGVSCTLDVGEAMTLAASGLVVTRPDRDGRIILIPNGRVGAVRVGSLQVEVRPKDRVNLTHLIFLLGYAADPGFRADDVVADRYDELWPALAETLARLGERALLNGVLQGYRTIEAADTVLRGRIRIGDQLRARPLQPVPLELSYDDYLTDIAENRILRTALRRMQRVPGVPRDTRSRLAHLDNRLDGVEILRPGRLLPAWRPTRLNKRYHPALRVAEIILANSSVEAGGGDAVVASFVVSMWKVFEDFVTVALREAFRRRGEHVEAQHRSTLDTPRNDGVAPVDIRPDILHLIGRRPASVLDAKYKASDRQGRYPNADQYQMLAYCTALRVRTAVLVYAQGDRPTTRRVRNTDIQITEYPLDLAQSPRDLLADLDALAGAIIRASRTSLFDLAAGPTGGTVA